MSMETKVCSITEKNGDRKTAISPEFENDRCDINVSLKDIKYACNTAFKGHSKDHDVIEFSNDFDKNVRNLFDWYNNGTYIEHLKYRKLTKRNKNGKLRNIDSPDLITRIYQHLVINKLGPLYYKKDNFNALNCKPGCGITASKKSKSLIKKLKHVFYDRLDLKYCLVIDQRKCYDHVKAKIVRKMLKKFVSDKKFLDFVIDVTFVSGKLPIGTPTSPFVHHILMKEFDDLAKRIAPFSVRYADDNFLAFHTKEDANAAKWRIKNYWWYVLQMRAKRHTCVIQSMDAPIDFCGYVFHRNNKGITEHDKGYVTIRDRVANDAKKSKTNGSWASYFGLLKHCDSFRLMTKIENKMKLRELTKIIKIDRAFDADNIDIKELEDKVFNIIDYDMRTNSKDEPNWIKCLISFPEMINGMPTGRKLAREFHGSYAGIVQFIKKCEDSYGKEALLPIEDVEVENRCGYIIKGSTNKITYID